MKANQMWKQLINTGGMLLIVSPLLLVALIGPSYMPYNTTTLSMPETSRRPSLDGATGWLNSSPLNLTALRGKVVLINFWTYTCINWRRTLPYVREWTAKYKDQGLVVIGVHTPEFSFEHDLNNLKSALIEMDISYPVAIDNNFDVWTSFQNEYWPALYLVDAKGKLRYQKFSEGEYLDAERQIQQLLKETSSKTISDRLVDVQGKDYEAPADWSQLGSAENFLGYEHTTGFASPQLILFNQPMKYTFPLRLQLNSWALYGRWNIQKENVRLQDSNGRIMYRFHARDLHLIMGASDAKTPVYFRVLLNGEPPGSSHGMDIDSNGNGILLKYRMYQLIRQPGVINNSEFQIEFLNGPVDAFDFTFG